MAVRKSDITNNAHNLQWPVSAGRLVRSGGNKFDENGVKFDESKKDTVMKPKVLEAVVEHMENHEAFGELGAEAFRAAAEEAKDTLGRTPTYADVRKVLGQVTRKLENERGAGRVNDGYVDEREAEATASPAAAAVYRWLDVQTKSEGPSRADVRRKASFEQIDQALSTLEDVVDAAFAAFPKRGTYAQLQKAVSDACKEAGLTKDGKSAVTIAVNGKTSRGDNGTLEGAPSPTEVKKALRSAAAKLKKADGAAVVDFKHPQRKPTSKKDKVVTGAEIDRTPSVTGKAALSLFKFAASL